MHLRPRTAIVARPDDRGRVIVVTVARAVPVRRRRWAAGCAALLALASAACTGGRGGTAAGARAAVPAATHAAGPVVGRRAAHSPLSLRGELLAASTDLGPSRASHVRTVVTLPGTARPASLYTWAASRRLDVRWQPGD